MTHSPDHAERAREAARDIRNAMQRSLRSGHKQAHMNYGPLTVCLDQIDAALHDAKEATVLTHRTTPGIPQP